MRRLGGSAGRSTKCSGWKKTVVRVAIRGQMYYHDACHLLVLSSNADFLWKWERKKFKAQWPSKLLYKARNNLLTEK